MSNRILEPKINLTLSNELSDLLSKNNLELKGNSDANTTSNFEVILDLLNSLTKDDVSRYIVLLQCLYDVKEGNTPPKVFGEFCDVYTSLKKFGLETRYLEKTLKNFFEADYEESIVNVGKAIESIAHSVLDTEEPTDSMGNLLYLLVQEEIIAEEEYLALEEIREIRNSAAHGEAIYTEASKEDARMCIIRTFKMIKKIIHNAKRIGRLREQYI